MEMEKTQPESLHTSTRTGSHARHRALEARPTDTKAYVAMVSDLVVVIILC
jgi:hypothetical protein